VEKEVMPKLNEFCLMVKALAAEVFGVQAKNLAIYFNTDHGRKKRTKSIAFNQGGRIFLNAAIYLDFQLKKTEPQSQIIHHWFMTLCHELAHNLEVDHNQKHECIMEAMANKYFLKLCNYLLSLQPKEKIPQTQKS